MNKKICSLTVLSLFLIALTCLALYLKNVADYKQAVKETSFSEINISDISLRSALHRQGNIGKNLLAKS